MRKENFMKKQIEFKDSKTLVNLARSYASECMEGAKYKFMAKKCEAENLDYLKTTLKTLAKHEMAHAKLFWDYITQGCENVVHNIEITAGYPFESGSLEQDFEYSSKNESELHQHIYPAFAKTAKDEGFLNIANTFKLIASVEEYHSNLLNQLGTKLKNKCLYKSPQPSLWECTKCGYSQTAKSAFKTCPLCGLNQGYVKIPTEQEQE